MECPARSSLIGRCSVCVTTIPYLVILPEYLASSDKTWNNADVHILFLVNVGASVILTSVSNTRHFLSICGTGRPTTTSRREDRTVNCKHGGKTLSTMRAQIPGLEAGGSPDLHDCPPIPPSNSRRESRSIRSVGVERPSHWSRNSQDTQCLEW